MLPIKNLDEIYRKPARQSSLERLFNKFCIFALIIICLFILSMIFTLATFPVPESQRLIKAADKAEIHRRLDARGLSRNTTVEISRAGYRFEFNGKFHTL